MERNEIFEFLRSLYLFNSLNDPKLTQVAKAFNEKSYSPGEILFEEGKEGDYFFIVVSGTIILERKEGRIGTVGRKEYLGEGALLHNRERSATAKSDQNSVVLRIHKDDFSDLVATSPEVKKLLNLFSRSYEIARARKFPWLGKDEVVRLIVKRHAAVLAGRLVLPAVLAGMSFVFSLPLFPISKAPSPLIFIFLILWVFLGLWGLWIWVDWGNDFYIVTDKRVVLLEKIVWFYDQRREAPLQTILSVNSSTNQVQRTLGYANVIVRTYTGQIVMRNAAHHEELEGMIKDYWHLSVERAEEEETAKLTQTIRSRLGFEDEKHEEEEKVRKTEGAGPKPLLPPKLGNLLKTRFEYQGVITYRKHLLILVKQIWGYFLIFAVLFLAAFFRILGLVKTGDPVVYLSVLGVYTVVSFPFWGYRLVDWANDRYQLTERKIVDLDRKPLGKENRRSAPLENILSLDYTRENFIQRLFNFGTVVINVGEARFDFENVVNPSMVQQEVFEHYHAAVLRKEEAKSQRHREDMVESLAIYHEENERYQRSQQLIEIPRSTSVEILWQEDLSAWITLLPKGSVLTLYRSGQANAVEAEIRVIFNINQGEEFLGKLKYNFPETPLRTIFLEIYAARFIIGWVDTSVPGNLVSVSMEREEGYGLSDEGRKTSVVKDRVFVIPILSEEQPYWRSIAWIGIKTVEASIRSGEADSSDVYAWENRFLMPITLDFS